ncbi:MAG: UvrB/UvrC motif-containing protein, partial [Duncaniella sp.]|nr:UvrB/UvrC motif-containing protein [Duncaniella sp.]
EVAAIRPKSSRRDKTAQQPLAYTNDYTERVDVAADPVVAYLSRPELEKLISRRRDEMMAAAKDMNFVEAARLRDEILGYEQRIEKMAKTEDA